MLLQAMDSFQVAKRTHKENVKAQYNDKKGANNGAKTYFRASEMGSEDRKIIYGFFAHKLPKIERGAKNLRQLENGDFVHDRYQSAWEEMGVSISQEVRLSSKDDEYLAQFPWEWAGHYDGLLDLNILRAHALGLARIDSIKNEDTGKWEVSVDIDDAYANSIGLFDADGNMAADYQPLTMVADIKTMNPWGFKRCAAGDVSDIQGYIDQIMYYMYMLGTPYGSIYIENKENNDICEVQLVWQDFYDGVVVGFDPNIHGEKQPEQVRIVVSSDRFFGSDTIEGCVPRLTRLYGLVEALQKADEEGDLEAIARLVPTRCSDKPEGFPCSWGHKTGKPSYCEYFDHCWNGTHQGLAVSVAPAFEPCPEELVWSFFDEAEGGGADVEIRIDSRKVPQGVDQAGFLQLVDIGALDYTKFLVDEEPTEAVLPPSVQAEQAQAQAEETAVDGAKNLFDETGELRMTVPAPPTEVEERIVDGAKTITCINCSKDVTYQKLGAGNTKKCTFCGHSNNVIRL